MNTIEHSCNSNLGSFSARMLFKSKKKIGSLLKSNQFNQTKNKIYYFYSMFAQPGAAKSAYIGMP